MYFLNKHLSNALPKNKTEKAFSQKGYAILPGDFMRTAQQLPNKCQTTEGQYCITLLPKTLDGRETMDKQQLVSVFRVCLLWQKDEIRLKIDLLYLIRRIFFFFHNSSTVVTVSEMVAVCLQKLERLLFLLKDFYFGNIMLVSVLKSRQQGTG